MAELSSKSSIHMGKLLIKKQNLSNLGWGLGGLGGAVYASYAVDHSLILSTMSTTRFLPSFGPHFNIP